MKKHTSLFENGLIWFGAGISLAEILTGTYFSPLGIQKGLCAILLGHLIGCVLFFLAGYMGAKTRKSSMETAKRSFGFHGGILFAVLNVIQLVGWTAIMIYDGALSANTAFPTGKWLWCLIIGALILVWILVGIENLGKINTAAMLLLFILTIILCRVIVFSGNAAAGTPSDAISFGAAVELAVSMPLSWLPVISDYTREAEKPGAATLVSTITYGLVSTWMFLIGMGASYFTGSDDIAQIMVKAGLGIASLLIIVFSTVTTTFLDAWSAGISGESIWKKLTGKQMALLATVIGTAAAVLFPMDDITGFLYFIGSVFAPMAAVMVADFYFLHRHFEGRRFVWSNLAVWLIGFLLYRFLMTVDLPIGNTLPDMVITTLLAVIVGKCSQKGIGKAVEKISGSEAR